MPRILQLDPHVADLIAAGEVVERPASVVKELIENCIDAGASVITAEISAGGMTYIRITDNGCGIEPEDVKTAFLRHATSKLKNAEGLEAIGTLGFRGEALAAIAAVSRIEFLTRVPGADEGTRLLLEAGNLIDFSPVGCPEGTTIIVRDLFYNTPARLKFMKSDRAEGSAVAIVVLRCALARPDVSVRFIKDGKTEYHTPGDSRVDSCVYSLFGREFSAGLLKADSSDEVISVSGLISSPDAARGNRSNQFFFVNGRPIKSLTLQTALEKAFNNLLPSGRFPSCILYISTKPSDVDVNVHPAKTEVKFVSDKQVFDGVYYAVLGALERGRTSLRSGDIGQDINTKNSPIQDALFAKEIPDSGAKKSRYSSKSGGGFRSMDTDEFRSTFVSEKSVPYKRNPFASTGSATRIRKDIPPYKPRTENNNSAGVLRETPIQHSDDNDAQTTGVLHEMPLQNDVRGDSENNQAPVEALPATPLLDYDHDTHAGALPATPLQNDNHNILEGGASPSPRIIGEAFSSYIIAQYDDSVWFIDKHAAHERLHFNALKSENFEPMSQNLITPVVCRFDLEDVSLILENSNLLDGLGFEVESFGDDSVAVRRIPSEIDIDETESILSDICSILRFGGTVDAARLDGIYKTIACKASIKAGKNSTHRELEILAAKVFSGEASHCPHGRPVFFEISKAELDKRFKRS